MQLKDKKEELPLSRDKYNELKELLLQRGIKFYWWGLTRFFRRVFFYRENYTTEKNMAIYEIDIIITQIDKQYCKNRSAALNLRKHL